MNRPTQATTREATTRQDTALGHAAERSRDVTRPKTRIGFVGPHLGKHPGWVVTQSEILARLFAGEGHGVRVTSSLKNPWLRVTDMVRSLILWRGRVDVVMLSVFSGRAFHIADIVSRAAKALSIPQIHVLRGGAFPELAAEKPAWARRVLGRAQAVVAPSPFLARTALELGLDADVIPNVLDLDAYPFELREAIAPGRALEMLWLRTFHPIYRPLVAVEVVAELKRRGVDSRLTLAGQDKGLEESCRVRAAELGLSEHVRFPGFLDAAGKRRELSAHDLYLHTNKVDNTPVTVLEAAAHGLPILATAVGGLPDLLEEGRTGLLIEDAPTAELVNRLADAALRLRGDAALVRRLSAGGRELAESCAWTVVHRRWQELFDRLLEPAP